MPDIHCRVANKVCFNQPRPLNLIINCLALRYGPSAFKHMHNRAGNKVSFNRPQPSHLSMASCFQTKKEECHLRAAICIIHTQKIYRLATIHPPLMQYKWATCKWVFSSLAVTLSPLMQLIRILYRFIITQSCCQSSSPDLNVHCYNLHGVSDSSSNNVLVNVNT